MIELKEIQYNELPQDQQKILGEGYSGLSFQVFDDGELVGNVCYIEIEDYCCVDTVFVIPDKRRSGIGTGIGKSILETKKMIVAQTDGSEASLAFFRSMDMTFNEDLKWWELKKD